MINAYDSAGYSLLILTDRQVASLKIRMPRIRGIYKGRVGAFVGNEINILTNTKIDAIILIYYLFRR